MKLAIDARVGPWPALLALLSASLGVGAARAQESLPRQVTIAAIPGIVAAGVSWQLVWQGPNNADGIVGTGDGGLLFAQEQPRRVGKLDTSGEYSIYLGDTRGVGSLGIDASGQLLGVERGCTDPGRRTVEPCNEPTTVSVLLPMHRVLASSFADGRALGRLNDLVAAAGGSVYFTVGGAYRVDSNGRVHIVADRDIRSNGIMLSPDERTLYVTNRDTILAFDVAPDGSTSNRRDFAQLEAGGNGDGMAVDAAGRVYVTSGPGVQVLAADGGYLGLIPTPRPVISAAFSGIDKRTLYVVGAGARGADGAELTTPDGVRNNAKTIYALPMLASGYAGRAK